MVEGKDAPKNVHRAPFFVQTSLSPSTKGMGNIVAISHLTKTESDILSK